MLVTLLGERLAEMRTGRTECVIIHRLIEGAPTVAEKLAMANIVKDEVRHGKAMYDLLDKFGIDIYKLIDEDKIR